jgi:hypothetical protein
MSVLTIRNWSFPFMVTLALSLVAGAQNPTPPTLLSPTNNAVGQGTSVQLSWTSVSGALSYTVDVSTSSAFIGFVDSVSFAGANATSYVPAGLITGTVYYWMVNATNAANSTSAWSSEWSFSTLAVPATPTLSSPSNGSANQPTTVTLAWISAARATSYAAEISTVSSFASTVFLQAGISVSPEVVSGLSVGTLYYWRVNANDASGNSAWSNTNRFTTALPAPTLTSPSNGGTGLAISQTLQWGTVTGATLYTVSVSTSSAFASTVLIQAGLSTSSYAAAGLANGMTFYWRANATDGVAMSPWAGAWNFTTIVAIPTAPILSSPTNGAANASLSPTLSWGSVMGAASYTFQLSTTSSFSSFVLKLTPWQQTSTVNSGTNYVSGLTLKTVYFWEVSATNVAGTSVWSSVWSFTVNPTAVAPANKIVAGPSFTLKNGMFAYSLNQQGSVEIMIYNILGRKVFSYNRLESSGNHALSIKNLNLSPELYIVHFKANGIEKELSVMGKRSD